MARWKEITVDLAQTTFAFGDLVSASAGLEGDGANGVLHFALEFLDAADDVIAQHDGNTVAPTVGQVLRSRVEGVTVPPGTARIRGVAVNPSGVGSPWALEYMLNAGPVALPYRPPNYRFGRDSADSLAGLDGETARRMAEMGGRMRPHMALGAFTPRVALHAGEIHYAIFEDGTVILRNGVAEAVNRVVGDVGSFGVNAGDVVATNRPVAMRMRIGYAVPPFALAARAFVYRTSRSYPHTLRVYAPYTDARVEVTIDQTDFAAPDHVVDIAAGTVENVTIDDPEEDAHEVRLRATAPVVAADTGVSNDRVLLMPAATEVLDPTGTAEHAVSMDGSSVTDHGAGYLSADAPFGVLNSADGAGGDAEMGMPVDALGDLYMVDHAITGYALAAIEPCVVRVYQWAGGGWDLYGEHDLSAASRQNPMQVAEADQGGNSGVPLSADGGTTETGPWRWAGTGRFALRTNTDTFNDEYTVVGYRSDVYLHVPVLTAEQIMVTALSALSADIGEATAGVLRSADGRLVLDLAARTLTVRDQNGTVRMRLGRLGGGAEDYGVQVYDADGNLALGEDDDGVLVHRGSVDLLGIVQRILFRSADGETAWGAVQGNSTLGVHQIVIPLSGDGPSGGTVVLVCERDPATGRTKVAIGRQGAIGPGSPGSAVLVRGAMNLRHGAAAPVGTDAWVDSADYPSFDPAAAFE